MRLAEGFFLPYNRVRHQILLSRTSAEIRHDPLRSATIRYDPPRVDYSTCGDQKRGLNA